MNHPHRLLLLVPLALLGAALLVRSRLPRPQTEGDKWLWDVGETTPFVMVIFGDAGQMAQQAGLSNCHVKIEDRQGIRTLLRALEGTSAFRPAPDVTGQREHKLTRGQREQKLTRDSLIQLNIGEQDNLCLTHEKQGYCLYRNGLREVATVSPQGIAHFREVLPEIGDKAKLSQDGYHIVTLGIE